MSSVRDSLVRTLDQAEWTWLEPHAQRDALLLVAPPLELVVVGEAMARDDAVAIKYWLEQGLLSRPVPAQLEQWKATPQRRFQTVIVQPYVLCQALELEMVD